MAIAKAAKKPPTLRHILDYIDKALARQDDTSRHLWMVMTALRGPDNLINYKLKQTGTVHIRRAAFPRTAKAAVRGYAIGADFATGLKLVAPSMDDGHAQNHIYFAILALNLIPSQGDLDL